MKLSTLKRDLGRARFALLLSSKARTNWLRKHKVFAEMGRDVMCLYGFVKPRARDLPTC